MIKKTRNFIISLGVALGIYSNVIGNSYSLINNKSLKSSFDLKKKQEFILKMGEKPKIRENFDIDKYLAFYNYEDSYFLKRKNKNDLNKSLLTNLFLYEKQNKNLEKNLENINLEKEEIIPTLTKFPDEKRNNNYEINDLDNDEEILLLARMILGEGEGCSKLEKIAIGYTAINRAKDNKKWNGTTIKEALLKEYQYESLNDKKRVKVLKKPFSYNKEEFLESLKIAEGIINGIYKDPTNGATHFYNPRLIKNPPKWANSKSFKYIGKIEKNWYHLFYKER
ncbi:cell wall hydrolase [Candidatus Woesearchaeota archaeon]|jgi:spore germination cell wall hydrolase CwlJ-like protein|nr:cell wall hydrolase [Candidatus Woesearchaeota archaeon]